MELHQVRYFLALAQSLNFTRAAEACNVTQSALTRAIQRLEAELGGPLLHRERSLTRLTALGEALRPMLETTYQAAEAARAQAASFHRRDAAPLRLGLVPSLPVDLLAPVLREVARLLPCLAVSIERAAAEGLGEQLLDSAIDAALMRAPERLPDRLHRWSLFEERLALLVPADPALAAADPVPIAALAELTLIARGDELDPMIEAAAGGRLVWRHRAAGEPAIQALVALGLGGAIAGERTPALAGLVRRPLDLPAHPIVLATVAGRPHGAAVDAFVRLARARAWEAS